VVDGKSGHFESPSLRAALIALRQANPEDRELLLNVRSSVSRDFMVEFSVLSAAEEDELDGALRTWQDKDALLLHLGRAHVFSYYRLFTQAAEESEAALALAPASPYLLALAMEAERGTGNSKQLEGLERRLAALPRKDPSR
jgi:Tfp pilus assembly protein PilF